MSLKNWSTTAGSNTSAPPNGAPEGWALSSINDTVRQVMADVRTLAANGTIASASSMDIGAIDATFLLVTGTTTITALGTVSAGIYKWLTFASACTITHNATSLISPTGSNISVAANQTVLVKSEGSGNWRIIGTAAAASPGANADITSMTALTAPTVAANPVRATDLQAQTVKAATTGGTGTAFTFTPTPAITAYATNQEWDVSFSAACGASPTFQVSGVATPPNLVKQNSDGTYSNLSAGAFPSGWQSEVKMVSTTQALVRSLPPGLITASGLTQSTARLLGRTTASTGAVEEITVSGGLTLSAGALTGGGILGTPVASTSGISIDFTGIPSGTKQIIITFNGVSTNGTSPLLLQIGTSGGISNTGYVSNAGQMATSSVTTVTSTAGFIVNGSMVAANTAAGSTVLTLVNSSTNAWVSSGATIINTSNATNTQAGNKTLPAVLDRVRVTTVNGTDTFDAGEINIQYQ